jgi:hypothetical protein
MRTPDLTKLKHALVNAPLHFYYEVTTDGAEVLRHIRVQQRKFDVPADGVTIDVVPSNSVGTEQIKNGTIQTEDISLEMKDKLNPTYDHEGEGIKLGGI